MSISSDLQRMFASLHCLYCIKAHYDGSQCKESAQGCEWEVEQANEGDKVVKV